MRHWILSFCFLISAESLLACGPWYPFGEDIRFSLFSPHLFDGGMNDFHYSASYFYDTDAPTYLDDPNVNDWHKLTGEKVSKELVHEAIYSLSAKEIVDARSTHPFVKKMFELGRRDHLEYLAFAKKHSYLNGDMLDPWGKEDSKLRLKRKKALGEAKKLAGQAVDPLLKRRYAFVAIRLAFYNSDQVEVSRLYRSYFNGLEEMGVDLYAKYFELQGRELNAERNFQVAQLFEKIPTKRRGLNALFQREIESAEVLNYAKTDAEKANVLLMYSMRKGDRQLSTIQAIYSLDPKSSLLPFLIVREINKLEDWILSPTYTAFDPVMHPDVDFDDSQEILHQRLIADREYARKVLAWINSNKTNFDPELVSSVVALLQFMTENSEAAYQTLNKVIFSGEDREIWRKRILGILKVAAFASTDLQSIELSLYLEGEYEERERYLFLIGRLFEFKGNLNAAASLYSHLNVDREYYDNSFVWAEPKGLTTYNISFYSDYFAYFDANYTAQDLVEITQFARNTVRETPNLQFLVSRINADKFKLLDLIGTKFLREANLTKSLSFLEQVPKTYWESDTNKYAFYLAANPFYADFYSAHKPTEADTIVYTKYEVVKKLNSLIELEKTQTGNAKAKTNFLIANCYFNMTTYGNSWMMRRSWWSTNTYNTVFVDNDEFNKCILAKAYYMKAAQASQSDGFEALCLRMAGRCESHALYFEHEYDYDFNYEEVGGFGEFMFNKNTSYKLLKQKYPDWHDELVSNCYSFNRFYGMI